MTLQRFGQLCYIAFVIYAAIFLIAVYEDGMIMQVIVSIQRIAPFLGWFIVGIMAIYVICYAVQFVKFVYQKITR